MRSAVALASLLLVLTACTDDDGGDVAADPAGSGGSGGSPAALEVPVPDGPVRTARLVTVMDTGTPELCLGAVAESYPPQCGGPAITNWDWATHGQEAFEQQGDVRWGDYALTGTWDGTAFTVTDAVPAALHNPVSEAPSPTPSPATSYTDDELATIGEEVAALPGVESAYGGQGSDGHVLADVVYDDGTIQAFVDAEYGAGVVVVSAGLLDATG
ncbi:hypothetical protein [Nocardioides sp. SYSU D00038]|uniref:hypothetical protein n=1 Tax=Nocardioides sp. SYSU D00038 TaxID=2812554 RepID=UPI001968A439|nr:hypothetical protein [Nocardioides sp. SYSU D00038]